MRQPTKVNDFLSVSEQIDLDDIAPEQCRLLE